MATVTGYTSQRMKIIEDTTVVDGEVRTDELILITREGQEIPAGNVRGPQGIKGDTGEVSQAELDAAMALLLTQMFKPGMLMMYAGGTLPTDWLKCDGQAVDRTTYAPLFAAISTNYGIGNGTTTFNVPNFSVKFPLGPGAAPNNILGYNGGASTHQLTRNELPLHQHDLSHGHSASSGGANVQHTHGYNGFAYIQPNGGFSLPGVNAFGWADQILGGSAPDHAHAITVNGAAGPSGPIGADAPHNNMPPYVVVNYMIHI